MTTFKYLSDTGLTVYDLKLKEFISGKYAEKTAIPTKTSQLTNDSNFVSGGATFTENEKTKLNGIDTGAQVNVIEAITVNGSAVIPSAKTVNITVPTDNKSLTNGAGYQTATQVTTKIESYGYQTAAQVKTTVENYSYQTEDNVKTIVTSYGYQTAANVTSAIEAYGYQTADDVNTIVTNKGYQTATQVTTKIESYGYQTAAQVASAVSAAGHLTRKVVASLPTTGEDNVIYLVPATDVEDQNAKDEYMWIESKWEKVGSSKTSLTGYVQETDLVAITEDEIKALFAA
jgi:hypothetical protein